MAAPFSNFGSYGRSTSPPPPPPRPVSFLDIEDPPPRAQGSARSTGVRFDAELDLSELDDRNRPGPSWPGRGRELGRSHLVLRTRRMCYQDRRLLISVHLIDDEPVPLLGRVTHCEYDTDGLYRVEIELLPLPDRGEIAGWIASRKS
jgi:hypothetical protein